jgi:flagellar transcriptional activator FlhC
VLESETDLSYERLLRLYKEVAGKQPQQGPAAVLHRLVHDLAAQHPCHLFLNIHEYLNKVAALDEIDTVIKAYQLYLEQMGPRAWSRCCRSPAPGAW